MSSDAEDHHPSKNKDKHVKIQDSTTQNEKTENEMIEENNDHEMTIPMNKSLFDDVTTEEDEEDDSYEPSNENEQNIDFIDASFQTPAIRKCAFGEPKNDGDGKSGNLNKKEEIKEDVSNHLDGSCPVPTTENLTSTATNTAIAPAELREQAKTEEIEGGMTDRQKENNPSSPTLFRLKSGDDISTEVYAKNIKNSNSTTDEELPFSSPCSSTGASVGGNIMLDIENEDPTAQNKKETGQIRKEIMTPMLPNIAATTKRANYMTTTMTPMMSMVALDSTKKSNSTSDTTTDHFIKSGTRLRTLLDSAVRKVALGFTKASDNEHHSHYYGDDEDDCHENMGNHDVGGYSTSFETAQETDNGGDITDNEGMQNGRSMMYEHVLAGSRDKRRRRRRSRENSTTAQDPPRRRRRQTMSTMNEKDDVANGRYDHAAELAKEKVAECMALKRALKEAQSQAEAMKSANDSLRAAAATSSERMARTTEALRIAGVNAANARADAEAANERATSLSSQLCAMRSALDEMIKSTEDVRSEHDEISAAARSVEGRLLQSESELARMDREKRRLEEERDDLRERAENAENHRKRLLDELDSSMIEAEKVKKALAEQEDVEKARVDRMHRIEKELIEARAMLVESTSAAAETESTTAVLKDTIHKLQRENKGLHDKIQEIFQSTEKERVRMNEALSNSEMEVQKIRMKSASDEEELQRLRLEKVESEKQIGQLRSKITNLERRLTEATTAGGGNYRAGKFVSSSATQGSEEKSSKESCDTIAPNRKKEEMKSGGSAYSIPPLRSSLRAPDVVGLSSLASSSVMPLSSLGSGKENINPTDNRKSVGGRKRNGAIRINNTNCCICFKRASGMMKSCMCGRPTCDKRAHASCVLARSKNAGPSVSHPCTPAPALPMVLCSGTNKQTSTDRLKRLI